MYQRILVPVDAGQTSELASREAIQLVGHSGGELQIVHMIEEVTTLSDMALSNNNVFRNAVRESGRQILSKSEGIAHATSVKVATKLVEVTPGTRIANAIVDEAKAWSADLIVIGTHGRHGFSHLLLGSVADGVIRLTSIPVLLIHGSEMMQLA